MHLTCSMCAKERFTAWSSPHAAPTSALTGHVLQANLTSFIPHFMHRRCMDGPELCAKTCIHGGRYCAFDSIQDSYAGSFDPRQVTLCPAQLPAAATTPTSTCLLSFDVLCYRAGAMNEGILSFRSALAVLPPAPFCCA